MSFYDAPVVLDYTNLEPGTNYSFEVVFVAELHKSQLGKTKAEPVRLLANGQLLKDYFLPPTPMQKLSVPLPPSVIHGGKLRIECNERKGLGGTGRTCIMAEAWLRRSL
jgi:hypothetical protein